MSSVVLMTSAVGKVYIFAECSSLRGRQIALKIFKFVESVEAILLKWEGSYITLDHYKLTQLFNELL